MISEKTNTASGAAAAQAAESSGEAPPADVFGEAAGGALVVNADDWGQDPLTTDRILDCSRRGAVSSVSAMVFMEDSERAAAVALHQGIEAGLHLNLTLRFSASNCPGRLQEKQAELAKHLLRHSLAQVVFHPGLMRSFEYVVAAQIDEYRRIYGTEPVRIDGHHHMHLCSNVLFQRLLPAGTIVRKNFSFLRGEKGLANRLYRNASDFALSRRHRVTDFFFSLPPFEPASRLDRIYALARKFVVEVETHPVNPHEYRYLMAGEIFRQGRDIRIAAPSTAFRATTRDSWRVFES